MKPAHKRYSMMLLTIAFGAALAACHKAPVSGDTADPAHPQPVEKRSHTPLGNDVHHVKPDGATLGVQTYAMLMDALPATDQRTVRDWYDRLGAPPIDSATSRQIAWMQARSYPMPADIARAASMNNAQLKAEASAGEPTAQILYAARLLSDFQAMAATGVSSNDRRRLKLVIEIQQTTLQALASGSPYAGYLYAARTRLMYPDQGEAIIAAQLAGLVWASKFGDGRANELLLAPTLQAVDATTAVSAVSTMLVAAQAMNPRLFTATVVQIPRS